MSVVRASVLLAVVWGLLGVQTTQLVAGTNGSGDGDSDDHKKVIPPPADQKAGIELPGFNLPPGLREQLGKSVLDALSRYQTASEDYLKKKRDVSERLRGATGDQRKMLLDQIRSNRDRFLTDTRDLRTEIHNQLAAERDKLRKRTDGRPGEKPH